jgi:hypothetical protein
MQIMPRSLCFTRLLVCAFLLTGCEETGPRVYTARLYHANDQGGCVDTYTPIGLVEADEIRSSCDAVCLLQEGSVYVSTVCAPYPSTAEVVAVDDSADCAAALALAEADAVCE